MYDCLGDICIMFVCACVLLLVCLLFLFLSYPNPGGNLIIFADPWQQMEQMSERAVERQVHEEEEPVAPRPRGR